MQFPTFSNLPNIVACPAWAPAVQTEYTAVCDARQAIETKRGEVLADLEKARKQDLAVFTPVQFNPRPMLQQELLFRRAYDAYLRSLMTAFQAYKAKCEEDLEKARDDIKKKLLGIGYLDPGAVPGRGSYSPDMIQRHETVRGLEDKIKSGFNMSPSIQENQQAMTDLESKLQTLLVSVA